MTLTESPHSTELTLEMRHTQAAELSEKAVHHHRNAARLHGSGDTEEASLHANIARQHAVAALMACDLDCEL